MNQKDWDKLDELLGKEGFGGYYDLCECIKMSIEDINKTINLITTLKVSPEKASLKYLVRLLNEYSCLLRKRVAGEKSEPKPSKESIEPNSPRVGGMDVDLGNPPKPDSRAVREVSYEELDQREACMTVNGKPYEKDEIPYGDPTKYVEIYCEVDGEERIMHTRTMNHSEAREWIEIAKNNKFIHFRIKDIKKNEGAQK